jgi:hypothetical protein
VNRYPKKCKKIDAQRKEKSLSKNIDHNRWVSVRIGGRARGAVTSFLPLHFPSPMHLAAMLAPNAFFAAACPPSPPLAPVPRSKKPNCDTRGSWGVTQRALERERDDTAHGEKQSGTLYIIFSSILCMHTPLLLHVCVYVYIFDAFPTRAPRVHARGCSATLIAAANRLLLRFECVRLVRDTHTHMIYYYMMCVYGERYVYTRKVYRPGIT